MTPDLFLTLGICLAILTVPIYLSALADLRSKRTSIICALIAAGSLGYAMMAQPGGYAMNEVPRVMIDTFASLIN
jgi:hypothetical protein